jgi:hypothetical protein
MSTEVVGRSSGGKAAAPLFCVELGRAEDPVSARALGARIDRQKPFSLAAPDSVSAFCSVRSTVADSCPDVA